MNLIVNPINVAEFIYTGFNKGKKSTGLFIDFRKALALVRHFTGKNGDIGNSKSCF